MTQQDIQIILNRIADLERAHDVRLTALETELRLLRTGRPTWPAVLSAVAATAAVLLSLIVAAATLS